MRGDNTRPTHLVKSRLSRQHPAKGVSSDHHPRLRLQNMLVDRQRPPTYVYERPVLVVGRELASVSPYQVLMGIFKLVKIIGAGHLGEFDRVEQAVHMGVQLEKLLVEATAHFKHHVAIHDPRIIDTDPRFALR